MKLSWFWSFDTAVCVFLYFGVCYVLLFKVNILVSYVLVPSSFRFQLCVCPLCPSLCLCVSLCLVSLFCFYVLFLVFHSPPPSPSPSQVCLCVSLLPGVVFVSLCSVSSPQSHVSHMFSCLRVLFSSSCVFVWFSLYMSLPVLLCNVCYVRFCFLCLIVSD